MKDDPYARLSGLDQQLFAPHAPAPTPVDGAASELTPPHGGTEKRPPGRPAVPTSGETSRRSNGRPPARTAQPSAGRKVERGDGAPKPRTIDRRSYDFFHDQVLWLSRIKLEIEERHDLQVTANAMVQLALDLFILDYQRRGRGSHLMMRLVFGQPLEGETGERPDGAASERLEGGD